jgi:hypothetical protein
MVNSSFQNITMSQSSEKLPNLVTLVANAAKFKVNFFKFTSADCLACFRVLGYQQSTFVLCVHL